MFWLDRRHHRARSRREDGMSTAEYAVGTVAAACIGCIIFQLADGDDSYFFDFLTQIFDRVSLWFGFDPPGTARPWLM